jgi:NADH-quinone oxidoreductase subunit E
MQPESQSLTDKIESILDRYQHDPSMLVSILQDIQVSFNYLPREALERVSKSLSVPLSQVYSVATFFKALSLVPRGRHLINVCLGTACHVRGAKKILEAVERDLGIEAGATTEDRRFTLETVNCVGACALGPVVIIDGEYHGQVTTEKIAGALEHYT